MTFCLEEHIEQVQQLLDAGVDPAHKNSHGKTAIDLLLETNQEKIQEEFFWTSYSCVRNLLEKLGYEKPSNLF